MTSSRGVLGYEMLTGELPFEGSIPVLLRQHVMDKPVRPRKRAPDTDIPPLFEELVMTCLEKEPASRFQTVPDLMGMLGHVWSSVRRRTRHSTYSATRAAPPAPAADAVPDPTVYQSTNVDVVWDGPALCEEVTRLHSLRGKRLAELAAALWGNIPPADVQELLVPIERLEQQVDIVGQEVALIRANMESR